MWMAKMVSISFSNGDKIVSFQQFLLEQTSLQTIPGSLRHTTHKKLTRNESQT